MGKEQLLPLEFPVVPGTLRARVAAAGGGPHLSCSLTGDGVDIVLVEQVREWRCAALHCPKNLSFADILGQDR